MTNVNEGEIEYYNVEEFYRIRYTQTRFYVLNYERRMNQIFRSDNNFLLGTTGILLGIRDNDVEYLGNDSGNCIAFVQEGELWCYDRVNNTISQVFSFRDAEGINNRENWNQHDISIIRVDEAGSISFVVSGYMNRGEHEGQVGISVYYYDGISHTVEEEVFIPSNKSYEVLQAELGQLMYVNEQKQLYLMWDSDVYKVNMNTFEVSVLAKSDSEKCYAISESGRYLAWVSPESMYTSREIHLEDLKTGIRYEVSDIAGGYVLPIDFVGEDFVYGVANETDVKENAYGEIVYPMSKVEILNTGEEKRDVIKSYAPENYKIGDVYVSNNNIYLELVTENNGRLILSGQDTIMNREIEPANSVKLKKSVTTLKQTQIAINMKEIKKDSAIKVIYPRHILLENARTVSMKVNTAGYYYVYARGKVLLATKDAGEAVKCANENVGVVVDANLKYVYKRARSTTQSTFTNLTVSEADAHASSLAKAVSIILTREGVGVRVNDLLESGQTPVQIMQSTLKESTVLELRDCGVEDVLYYIDQGNPVLVRTGVDKAILLIGYSSNYIAYYDANSRLSKTCTYEEMASIMEAGDNYFIAYIK